MDQTNYIKVDTSCQIYELSDGNYLMPGCKFSIKNGSVNSAFLLSDNIDKGIQFLQDTRVPNIYLDTYNGYNLQDTNCLFSFPDITGVFIRGSWMDKSGLHSLNGLHRLEVDDWNSDVDLSVFPEIQFFSGYCCENLIMPFEFPKMEKLRLWKYKKNDMTSFPVSPNIRSLQLIQSKLKNLEGIELLNNSLQYLSIGYCRSLMDLNAILKLNLLALELQSIPIVEQLPMLLPQCSSLLGISIDCPSKVLPSLVFLNRMANLKCFVGLLKDISDGDLTPTVRLDNVWIPIIRRHYNLQKLSNKYNTTWMDWLKQEGMYKWWPSSR